ncbi:isoprenylcysteine alpha-carbonyl methylesterase ICME-like [Haliotis rufescens]|uniref:isoprenylcysteine alpha-carbonyl methylesterase ICME-like n=1 Tax=Haliotis rufescens TaxID=6454 RepID=UPI001EAFBD98|nr:isoprenylcysteine alpha-carbonyl methylesterase ICME-like [Haliotis rufescens]
MKTDTKMLKQIVKSVFLLASSAVAVPYTVAFLCNVLYGWPQSRDKYKRAFHPRKVYALNYAVLQKLLIFKYAPLYFRWKFFYSNADRSILAKDLSYGRNDRTLDVYSPFPHNPVELRPVVIFVFGGAWGSGDKSRYGLLCMQIASKLGVIVCCLNYSLYPQGYVDDMVQDVVDGINWVHENIHTYGGNKDQIMLIGHSSGAHLSSMAILELLHDERIQIQPFKGRQLQFDDQHYTGSNNNSNGEEQEGQEGSSGSSESFALLSDNGDQHTNDINNSATSTFEVLNGQQAGKESTMASSESRPSDDSMDVMASPTEEGAEQVGVAEGGGGEEEEEEDSGDDDSVVTVRPKDIERHATLVDLCKSVKAFVGLAGVYNIADHYVHEYGRGVEDISSMGRAMYGEDHFERFSPTVIIKNLGRSISLPKMVLVHGTEDKVVPLSSTTRFSDALSDIFSDVTVRVLPGCDHFDIMLDLMMPERRFYDSVMGILMETCKKVF